MDLTEEVRALRYTVGQMSDQLTRLGVGPKLMKTPECAEFCKPTPGAVLLG